MITVEKLINKKVFKVAKILAGKKGMNKIVRKVTVAEVPDAANWLHGGELVCTTAYFISKEVKYQVEWIESLSNNGAVALAIKTDRFLGEVPESIIEVANNLNFPIIELPPEITWPEVIESVMNPIMHKQIQTLQRADEIHTKLTSLVLADEPIKVIADQISSLVGNPIIIEDARLELIAIGESDININEGSTKVVKERLSESFKNKLKSTAYYDDVIRNRTKNNLEIYVEVDDRKLNTVIAPILSNKMVYGFITLVDVSNRISEIDLIALKHGASTLALQFMKQIIHKQTLQNKYIALVDDLVHGRIHSELVNEYRIGDQNWGKIMNIAVVDLMIDRFDEEAYIWDRSESQIIKMIKNHLLKHFRKVIIGNNESLYTIIVSQSYKNSTLDTSVFRKELLYILNVCIQRKKLDGFWGGIGNNYDELRKLDKCFKEAKIALSIAKSFSSSQSDKILLYESLGIYRIISMIDNLDELKTFCNDFLSDLKEYDKNHNDVLMETLHVYLKNNCIIKETAKSLFIHSNTVTYRLKKIQSILKHDLNALEVRLTYLFALEANKLLERSH